MERKECEKLIFKKLKEIKDIYLQYNPQGDFLKLCFMKENKKNYILVLTTNTIKKIKINQLILLSLKEG